jgi:hypothetical protein
MKTSVKTLLFSLISLFLISCESLDKYKEMRTQMTNTVNYMESLILKTGGDLKKDSYILARVGFELKNYTNSTKLAGEGTQKLLKAILDVESSIGSSGLNADQKKQLEELKIIFNEKEIQNYKLELSHVDQIIKLILSACEGKELTMNCRNLNPTLNSIYGIVKNHFIAFETITKKINSVSTKEIR